MDTLFVRDFSEDIQMRVYSYNSNGKAAIQIAVAIDYTDTDAHYDWFIWEISDFIRETPSIGYHGARTGNPIKLIFNIANTADITHIVNRFIPRIQEGLETERKKYLKRMEKYRKELESYQKSKAKLTTELQEILLPLGFDTCNGE